MKKKSVYEMGMGSRKGYVSKFQVDESKTDIKTNNASKKTNIIFFGKLFEELTVKCWI